MNKKILLALFLSSVLAGVQAQDSSPFFGTWTVQWEGSRPYEAKLVLGAQGGTWRTHARNTRDACVGREVPVRVDSISPTEARLTWAFAETLQGCENQKVTLKAGSGGVTGARGKTRLALQLD